MRDKQPPAPIADRPDYESGVQGKDGMELRVWLRLLTCTNLLDNEVRTRLKTTADTTLPRFDVMSVLYRHPEGLKMNRIADLLRVANGNITGIVDRLTADGLALRVAVPGDRRANLVRLTPTGITSFEAQAANHEDWIDEMLTDLNRDDLDGMIQRLDQLLDTLEEAQT